MPAKRRRSWMASSQRPPVGLEPHILESLLLHEQQRWCRRLGLMRRLRRAQQYQHIVRLTLYAPILLRRDQRGRRLLLDIEQKARLLASMYRLATLLLDVKDARQHGTSLGAVAVAQQPLRDDDAQ